MIHAHRSQSDSFGDEASLATGKDFSEVVDLARQEYREEADVNVLLGRYGVQGLGAAAQPQPQFGEVDWDIDLHTAHISVERSQLAYYHLPPELRKEFQSPAAMLDAMNSGKLELALREHYKRPVAPSPAPGEPVPPSDG